MLCKGPEFLFVHPFVLLVILFVGKIGIGAAIAFVSIYVVYAFIVAANELLRKHARLLKLDAVTPLHARLLKLDAVTPLLPVQGSVFSVGGSEEDTTIYSSLLDLDTETDPPRLAPSLPQWMWSSNVAIYSNQANKINFSEDERPPWGWSDGSTENTRSSFSASKLFLLMEMPLAVPRRLTIPMVHEEVWSKSFAVASASLAPILLAFLWSTQDNVPRTPRKETAFVSAMMAEKKRHPGEAKRFVEEMRLHTKDQAKEGIRSRRRRISRYVNAGITKMTLTVRVLMGA